ncbi:MAG: hypothetical protein QXS02_01340 [Candidatus Thermoplasmatota archaeon]
MYGSSDNNKRDLRGIFDRDAGVSEVVGTLLLIGIGISLFAGLAIVVYTTTLFYFPSSLSSVYVVGFVQNINDQYHIILHNYGGEPLPSYMMIRFTIGEDTIDTSIKDLLGDDHIWGISEKISYYPGQINPHYNTILGYAEVKVSIIDPNSNALILETTIQEGIHEPTPRVITDPATGIDITNATLNLRYDFKKITEDRTVAFEYREKESQNDFILIGDSVKLVENSVGSYSYNLQGLSPGRTYEFRGVIKWKGADWISGITKDFKTLTYVLGEWRFDEESGPLVKDSSGRGHHGSLYPNSSLYPGIIPVRVNGLSQRAVSFDGYNDYAVIPDQNDELTPSGSFTVEGWIKPSTPITVGVPTHIDTSLFGNQNLSFYEPQIHHVKDDLYVMISRNYTYHGFIATFNVSSEGVIEHTHTTCFKDIEEFDVICRSPRIIHVGYNGNKRVYGVFYYSDKEGKIVTIGVDNITGEITVIKSFIFDTDIGVTLDAIKVKDYTNSFFLIVYSSFSGSWGRFRTCSISPDGNTISVVSFNQLVTGPSYNTINTPDVIYDNEKDTYLVVYSNSDTDILVRNITVNPATGVISVSDSIYINENDQRFYPHIMKIRSNMFLVTYYHNLDPYKNLVSIFSFNNNKINFIKNEIELIKCGLNNPSELVYIGYRENGGYRYHFYGYIYTTMGSIFNSPYLLIFLVNESNSDISVSNPNNLDTMSPCFYYGPVMYPIYNFNNNEGFVVLYFRGESSSDTNNGIIKTIKITVSFVDGKVSLSIVFIDEWNMGVQNCMVSKLIHVSGDVYAVLYLGYDYRVYLKTFRINSNGVISRSYLYSYCFPDRLYKTILPYLMDICHLYDSYFIVAYSQSPYGSYGSFLIKVIKIDDAGIITDIGISITERDLNIDEIRESLKCKLIQISDDKFIFVQHYVVDESTYGDRWRNISLFSFKVDVDNKNIGRLSTCNVSSYSKSDAILLSKQVDKAYLAVVVPSMIYTFKMDIPTGVIDIVKNEAVSLLEGISYVSISYACNDAYLVFSKRTGLGSRLSTLYISPVGDVIRVIDPGDKIIGYNIMNPEIIRLSGDKYLFIFTNSSSKSEGYAASFRVSSDTYNISYNLVNKSIFNRILMLDSLTGVYPSVVKVNEDIFAVSYQGSSADGYIETIRVNHVSDVQWVICNKSYDVFIKKTGDNTYDVECRLTFTENQYTLSVPVYPDIWNYIAVVYNKTTSNIKMYNYNNQQNHISSVDTTSGLTLKGKKGSLLFGSHKGVYDEILLHAVPVAEDYITTRFNSLKPSGG